ncbi:MAG: hypothetical protein K8S16_19735 [Bacteroidales bacterium]|nr:hypothetical protein [Bacteroidales bacterium]
MIKYTLHKILMVLAVLLLFAACKKVVVVVDSIPSNTPAGDPLFIVGNFNSWDPGDERFRMNLNTDSTYSITLPPGFGTVEYKFTRGDWTTIEKDICGYEINNHLLYIKDSDTSINQIESWNDLDPIDCPRITIVVNDLPQNTPINEFISIAGNFNSWNSDTLTTNKEEDSGKFFITIDRPSEINIMEFKMTRGNLATSESDEFGNILPNRVIPFGLKDTVEVNIEGWIDTPRRKGNNRVVFIISNLPDNTPSGDEIYLASNLNNWMPGDRNYIFQKNRMGDYFFPFPRKKDKLEFKITRGSWYNNEVDRFGFEIPNRQANLYDEDTVFLDIQAWKDLSDIKDHELTFIIDKLPETTPADPDIYIAGNFNNWDPNRRKYKFEWSDKGYYFLNLERGRHDIECKITRGSWRNSEVDGFGSDIPNRHYYFKDMDTVYISIKNWKDKPTRQSKEVTIVVNNLPDNTPQTDNIYLAPDFNGWNPHDANLIFKKLTDGRFYFSLPESQGSTEYKITRGGWEKVEVDENGNPIPNRTLNYGFSDTVYIEVIKWRDMGGNY